MLIDEIRKMAQQKKAELIQQDESLDKINATLEFLEDDDCFFQISGKLAIPVLQYLGIEEKDVMDVYLHLLSFDHWRNRSQISSDTDTVDL